MPGTRPGMTSHGLKTAAGFDFIERLLRYVRLDFGRTSAKHRHIAPSSIKKDGRCQRGRDRLAREDIMSAVGIEATLDLSAAPGGPNDISRRLESLPTSSYLWRLVVLLSL